MKKFRWTIARKISISLAIILLLFAISGVFSVVVLQQSRNIDDAITNVYQPSLDNLKELGQRINESQKFTNNWIYQPNEGEKKELKKILDESLPALTKALEKLSAEWTNQKEADTLKNMIRKMPGLMVAENKVMKTLVTPDDYNDAAKIETSIAELEGSVVPYATKGLASVHFLTGSVQDYSKELVNNKFAAFNRLRNTIIVLALLGLGIGIFASFYLTRSITNPILQLKEKLTQLSQGEIPLLDIKKTSDEIGEMVVGMEVYLKALHGTSIFAGQIGKGEFDTEYNALSEKDVLGNSLLSMRTNLKKSGEDERKRNWAVTGLAKLGEILRNQDEDLEKFGDRVLSFAVKYTSSNQGRLYIVNDDVKGSEYLQMISCYAWEKKKFMEDKVEMGQGLTGQCWQEGEPIYMTSVPDNYVKITSGLGLANPRNIFIVPLKVNEMIYGVLELASFKVLQDHERDFILKLSENLGAAISTVRINHKTKTLLAQTQQQAEEMRSQEEEMRQNMEELSATQEEMGRKEKEHLKRIRELENKLGIGA
jgi:methyl-accepting chemotaxis protein